VVSIRFWLDGWFERISRRRTGSRSKLYNKIQNEEIQMQIISIYWKPGWSNIVQACTNTYATNYSIVVVFLFDLQLSLFFEGVLVLCSTAIASGHNYASPIVVSLYCFHHQQD
jgi:hypothetical protein